MDKTLGQVGFEAYAKQYGSFYRPTWESHLGPSGRQLWRRIAQAVQRKPTGKVAWDTWRTQFGKSPSGRLYLYEWNNKEKESRENWERTAAIIANASRNGCRL